MPEEIRDFRLELAARLEVDAIEQCDQRELMELVATIWGDVELAAGLHGSEQFFWERLQHYAARGYLTAQEEQGTKRLLALSYRQRLGHLMGQTAPADE